MLIVITSADPAGMRSPVALDETLGRKQPEGLRFSFAGRPKRRACAKLALSLGGRRRVPCAQPSTEIEGTQLGQRVPAGMVAACLPHNPGTCGHRFFLCHGLPCRRSRAVESPRCGLAAGQRRRGKATKNAKCTSVRKPGFGSPGISQSARTRIPPCG